MGKKDETVKRKGCTWCVGEKIEAKPVGNGVKRKILAFCEELMCVENIFEKGGVGELHHHPHTQITYVAKGRFRFKIGDEVKEVKAGDTMLKQNNIVHGCECLEDGILVDFFTPMREDFLKEDNHLQCKEEE